MLDNNASSTLSKKDHNSFFNSFKMQQEFQVNSLKSFSQINELEETNILNKQNFAAAFNLIFPQKHTISLIEENDEMDDDDLFLLENTSKKEKLKEIIPSLKLSSQILKKTYFKINTDKIDSLFNKNDSTVNKNEVNLLEKKRNRTRRPRKDNKDNIRKKIKRGFLNAALFKKLNEKLRSIGSNQYFERFPSNFACDIDKKRNKEILNLKLKDIFEKEELYKNENNKGRLNYAHNLKVINREEIKQNQVFKIILNKTFVELYEEYINSEEFGIEEVERLKKKKMDDAYIRNYINLAKSLVKFFTL